MRGPNAKHGQTQGRAGGNEANEVSKSTEKIKSTKPNNQKPPERATGGRRADGRSNSGTMSVTDDAAAAEPGCGGSGLLVRGFTRKNELLPAHDLDVLYHSHVIFIDV